MNSFEEHFLTESSRYLGKEFFPKIKEAVGRLEEDEVWHRENEQCNSIGNLLLHLSGNVRQHIVCGAGGFEDTRDRPSEFSAKGGKNKAELLAILEKTVDEACGVLETLEPSALHEHRLIQNKNVLLFDDIYHVVEHFSNHTGQILHMVKAMKGRGFEWYNYLDPKSV